MRRGLMVLALAGAAAVLAAAGFTAAGVAAGGELSAEDESALKVAEILDSIVQPRFQTDSGVFGLSRIVTISGHERVAGFKTAGPAEARALEKAGAFNREYLISFLHVA